MLDRLRSTNSNAMLKIPKEAMRYNAFCCHERINVSMFKSSYIIRLFTLLPTHTRVLAANKLGPA